MSEFSYSPDQPAPKVHASLRNSLVALDDAHKCAVLWFGEIIRRRLFRDMGHSSINQYAKGTRKELVKEVKKAKHAAKVDPGQGELLPSSPTVVAPRELPVCFRLNLTPGQEARRSAMVERLHKLGGVPTDRAELMLESLAALLETKELQNQKCPRGHLASRPPVQIHVHENAATGCMTVQTDAGERELSKAESERMRCDAAVCEQGGRNTTTIPPRVRREVLARDQHRCQAPGCGRTRFLEIHHIVSRQQGGSSMVENLMTLCASCHRLWHERGGGAAIENPTGISAPVTPHR